MFIHQSKAKANLDGRILFANITHLKVPIKLEKMPVSGLYGNRKFHVPLWSMIYVALKFTLQVSEMEL